MPDSNKDGNSRLLADPVISEAFARPREPRRILVYAPMAFSTPHFETDLEIAQRHIDLGDHVDLVLCDAELPSCQLNPHHELRRCVQCVSRSLQGGSQLSSKAPVFGILASLRPEDSAEIARLPKGFVNQDALRNFSFDGFDAGLATLSSLIDFARTPEFDTQQHAALVHRTLVASVATFLAVRRILAGRHYDRAYIYNGRWSMMRSAVRACESSGVPYYTHERGTDFRKFALYKNVLPHDKLDFQIQADRVWKRASPDSQAHSIARAFFDERRRRVEKNWFSFTKHQEVGRVPADWDRDCRRIVLYSTSEYEFAAIGEGTEGKIFPTQVDGMRRIASLLSERSPGAHLWVRVHPNDDNPESFRRWIRAATGLPNVTLVLPGEKIDSYAMLDGSERVLTFGSTVGVEATYWGKPSICGDFSFYDGLDAQYEAADEEGVIELLCRPNLVPKARENALKFGYYLNTFGENFLHFSTAEISDYEFKSPFRGRCLKPDYSDLRQRLLEIFNDGGLVRAATLSRLLIAFNRSDTLGHSVLTLCLLRGGRLDDAIKVVESAAGILTPLQFESVLKSSGSELVKCLSAQARSAEFAAMARRTAVVLAHSPLFAEVGAQLRALASRGAAFGSPVLS